MRKTRRAVDSETSHWNSTAYRDNLCEERAFCVWCGWKFAVYRGWQHAKQWLSIFEAGRQKHRQYSALRRQRMMPRSCRCSIVSLTKLRDHLGSRTAYDSSCVYYNSSSLRDFHGVFGRSVLSAILDLHLDYARRLLPKFLFLFLCGTQVVVPNSLTSNLWVLIAHWAFPG